MPNGIVPDESLADELLAVLVNPATEFAPWTLILFVNNYTPNEATTLADLTEASFQGYSRRSLMPGNWQTPVVADHVATSEQSITQVWTNEGDDPVTVYGSAYLDTTTGRLRKVQRFDPDDIVAVVSGGTIADTPRFSYRSQFGTE